MTKAPCEQCAKLIAQSGITKVIYKEKYKTGNKNNLLINLGLISKEF